MSHKLANGMKKWKRNGNKGEEELAPWLFELNIEDKKILECINDKIIQNTFTFP